MKDDIKLEDLLKMDPKKAAQLAPGILAKTEEERKQKKMETFFDVFAKTTDNKFQDPIDKIKDAGKKMDEAKKKPQPIKGRAPVLASYKPGKSFMSKDDTVWVAVNYVNESMLLGIPLAREKGVPCPVSCVQFREWM